MKVIKVIDIFNLVDQLHNEIIEYDENAPDICVLIS